MSAPSEQGFSHLSGKKVLVTGGTGFVGRHLLPRLLESGARVTCLTRAASRTEHLPGDVAVARADLGTGHGLAAALAGQDVVIHMAALLFGLFRALSNVYAGFDFLKDMNIPGPVYNMMPYIISLVVLAFTSKKSRAPKAEGIPYDKGQR